MKPIPESETALLWSDAAQAWTQHKFVETREVEDAYEFIYACTVTGQERRWGLIRQEVMN